MFRHGITCAGPRPRGCAGRACPWQPPGPCSAAAASPALLLPPAQGARRGVISPASRCLSNLPVAASKSLTDPCHMQDIGHCQAQVNFTRLPQKGIWCAGPWAQFKLQREVFTQQKDAVQGEPASKHLREKEGHESRSASEGLGAPGTPGRAAGCRAGSPARRTR